MSIGDRRGRASVARSALALALLGTAAGCGTTYMPSCEDTVRVVTDDEMLPIGLTVADLSADLATGRQAPGLWADDTPTTVSFSATRGEGAAEWIESEPITVEERGGPPFSKTYPMIAVLCAARARIPIDLSLTTDDGELAIQHGAWATASEPKWSDGTSLTVDIDEEPGAIGGLPAFDDWFGDETTEHGEPLVPDRETVTVTVMDEAIQGLIGWSGEYRMGDSHVGWSQTLLSVGGAF